jgi:hypothetical protein
LHETAFSLGPCVVSNRLQNSHSPAGLHSHGTVFFVLATRRLSVVFFSGCGNGDDFSVWGYFDCLSSADDVVLIIRIT